MGRDGCSAGSSRTSGGSVNANVHPLELVPTRKDFNPDRGLGGHDEIAGGLLREGSTAETARRVCCQGRRRPHHDGCRGVEER